MVNVVCEICKVEFESKRKTKKFCSSNCHNIHRYGTPLLKDITCLNCNRIVKPIKREQRFCSNACSSEHRKKQTVLNSNKLCVYCGESFISKRSDAISCGKRDIIHRQNESVVYVDVNCVFCNKSFKKRTGDYNRTEKSGKKHFCSKECSANSHYVELKCSTCGKVYRRKKSRIYGKEYNFCSRECQDKNIDYILRGNEHYFYKDGKSSGNRGKGWKRIRKQIRKRDNNTCQHCGITKDELNRELDVHHVIPYRKFKNSEEANSLENLIALCPSCHHKEEHKIII